MHIKIFVLVAIFNIIQQDENLQQNYLKLRLLASDPSCRPFILCTNASEGLKQIFYNFCISTLWPGADIWKPIYTHNRIEVKGI